MLKNILASFILLGCVGLPATAETIKLDEPHRLEGTFEGLHMGQILMRTDEGDNLELPSMTLFWYAQPAVQRSGLKVGQRLSLELPEDSQLTVIDSQSYPTVLGDYEGIHKFPSETVAGWQSVDLEAASR